MLAWDGTGEEWSKFRDNVTAAADRPKSSWFSAGSDPAGGIDGLPETENL